MPTVRADKSSLQQSLCAVTGKEGCQWRPGGVQAAKDFIQVAAAAGSGVVERLQDETQILHYISRATSPGTVAICSGKDASAQFLRI